MILDKLVLASGNQGKLKEIQALLAQKNVICFPQTEFHVPDAVEDGLSFVENAIIKARHASRLTGLPALGDDSGLAVDALGGAPGIYSARYAEVEGDRDTRDAANNTKLLRALEGVPEAERTARFLCVMALVRHADDPVPLICEGAWEGRILTEEAGTNGFGYDPLFYVPDQGCASAELPPELKNKLSHRGQALQALIQRWP